MKFRSMTIAGAALLAGAVWSQASYASTFTVDIWTGVPFASAHATAANVPGTTPTYVYDFTTTTGTLNLFESGSGDNTITGYLATEPGGDGSFSCVGSCAGAGTAGILQNTLFEITGTTFVSTSPETYSVTHDDGASLYIDGITVIQRGQPTTSDDSTEKYSGPTGNQSFELVYGENSGLPAQLLTTIPVPSQTATTPLPATLPLLATGLGFLGFLGRKKRKAASAFAA